MCFKQEHQSVCTISIPSQSKAYEAFLHNIYIHWPLYFLIEEGIYNSSSTTNSETLTKPQQTNVVRYIDTGCCFTCMQIGSYCL